MFSQARLKDHVLPSLSAAEQQPKSAPSLASVSQKMAAPPPPPTSASPPRFLVIGAGQRGRAYAGAIVSGCNGVVAAVAEPDDYKRRQFGRTFIFGVGRGKQQLEDAEGTSLFRDWRDFIGYEEARRARATARDTGISEGVDAALVCVLDEMHREVVLALCRLGGLHIMCEKPLATRLSDCVDMYSALRANEAAGHVFSIGHVLRYSPHHRTVRRLLLQDRAVGDILSVVHTEPVGWWHFTHSYVRGNWRRESSTASSLLTKSCHDIDLLLWLLCSPASLVSGETRPHLPSTVSSTGALQYFRKSRKPRAAGEATNCLSCPVEEVCKYSAKRIYVGDSLMGLRSDKKRDWPVSVVVPDIESLDTAQEREERLLKELSLDYERDTPDDKIKLRNWFGRCVYESDNDVCDDQFVTMTWDEDPLPSSSLLEVDSPELADPLGGRGAKSAIFHMVAQTKRQCERFTHVYGTEGELYADSRTITVEDFRTGESATYTPQMESDGHGGGDVALARQFVLAVDRVKNHGWESGRAQRETIGCTLQEVIRSHAMVFCAEEARKGKKVVDWANWWRREVEEKSNV